VPASEAATSVVARTLPTKAFESLSRIGIGHSSPYEKRKPGRSRAKDVTLGYVREVRSPRQSRRMCIKMLATKSEPVGGL
jgi:hypothetical protein